MVQERDVLENALRKLFDATWKDRIFFLSAVEVQEEPVGKLDLEKQANEIRQLAFRLRK